MDLTQKKLSKSEWLNVEVPFPDKEKAILKLIIDGYHNNDICCNDTLSLLGTIKLDSTISGIHEYLYKEYFEPIIKKLIEKYPVVLTSYESPIPSQDKKLVLKKSNVMKINNLNSRLNERKNIIIEFILLEICTDLFKCIHTYSEKYAFHLYTIMQIRKSNIRGINKYIISFLDKVIDVVLPKVRMNDVINQAYTFIEKNPAILKYQDITLFQHQKDIFKTFNYSIVDNNDPISNKLEAQDKKGSKLVLYTAPTGTGKTLTPLGLSEGYRIIFICAARHVGLALAKSAVCLNKRIAIAFGCETVDDIRLHYYAASEYSINRRTGGIGKVDNTVGDKVEIMICDIKSYLIAMRYMLAFTPKHNNNEMLYENISEIDEIINDLSKNDDTESNLKISKLQEKKLEMKKQIVRIKKDADLITYWDEPTISMDYDEHPLHELIKDVWCKNEISKMVLSCATLPKEEEIGESLQSFKNKFQNATTITISSFDCRKSISLLNQNCKAVLPHLIFNDYHELQSCVKHCMENKSLLRYFDLPEIIKFINKVHETNSVESHLKMEQYFENGIIDVTMNNLKQYYLHLLKYISEDKWEKIHSELTLSQKSKFEHINKLHRIQSLENSANLVGGQPLARTQSLHVMGNGNVKKNSPANVTGLNITTVDAHTLTDGPTIFLSNNVENLGKYYLKQTNLPDRIYNSIYSRVESNTAIQKVLTECENELEYLQDSKEDGGEKGKKNDKKSDKKNDKKINRQVDDNKQNPSIRKLSQKVEVLRQQIQMVSMDDVYIPNTQSHQRTWTDNISKSPYSPSISEDDVCKIMALDVDNNKKMLLLLGIGVFIDENTANPRYMEIMKKLAYNQHLYLILASSDYIYGTNYQFCHGYIGKDLLNMTQQKTIQALGRIGRNNMQNEYTIRFRDDSMLNQLFSKPEVNKEAVVMNSLFIN